ncbi:23S rRNA (uracil-5-)-methyltransferase RumA [Parvibaculum lavamentivorans DS-1]|uniref:23S rRNA (Uracil-5-)-methyltransferase RumA n=1 Tax=Parvibaculum lavamentivorans (strain DS-1 / DSM 13023 / NCIMB 13966) TaxID=402881 RepID=A7HR73_PARL1|nr:class I SAM-dependent RNA methyltransferase [Parvibaculum lavamentivorans]ABS62406.1 23S rRNA (uracil-5-)-methyltransferase RumA [Parvibaculum lavamentivorans DS-1]
MTAEIEIVIETLGAQADGVAQTPQGPLYVPYVLPQERVLVRPAGDGRAELRRVLDASADRIAPACPHFTFCGGCSLQHMEAARYADWKWAQVATALRARGIEAEIAPLVPARPRSRRRATFAATRTKKTLAIGYYAQASHTIVPIAECPLVVPEIERALPALAGLVAPGLSRTSRASVLVTSTASGLDVAVTGGKPLDGPLRLELAARASAADIARLSWGGEIVAGRRPPFVDLSGLAVLPPPGAFLQPTREGEAALVRLVAQGVGKSVRIADLFAGCGTFSASLARSATVHAVEGESASLAALARAVREQGPSLGLKPVTHETRDLARRPLLRSELDSFDAVVFDPPRAGAAAQAEEIARSEVPVVAAVSCNPATFARDARTLLDGGYALSELTPVDQFLWSPHIELVGIFRKG